MYNHPRRVRRNNGRSKAGYFLPFLILVSAIVVLVLAFNFIRLMFTPNAETGASVHIVEGDVQLKVWGTESFFALRSDTVVMPGDQLVTGGGGKVIVEFFDGTLARIDGASDVLFDVMEEGDDPLLELTVNKGKVWFNRVYKGTEGTDLKVALEHVKVLATAASVFEVEDFEDQEVVRVMNSFDETSGAMVEVYSENHKDVVENEEVSIAQEVTFNQQVLARYWQFKSPTILRGLATEFQDSDWYKWNLEEDRSPTEFERAVFGTENVGLVPVEPEVVGEEEVVAELEEEVVEEPVIEESVTGDLAAPKVVSVSGGVAANADGFYVVANNPAVIKGTISGANQIVVNGYALQKFTPGSGSWTYFANADFGLMKEGENTFEVYGVDASGAKGAILKFKVLYQPTKVEAVVPVVAEEKAEEL